MTALLGWHSVERRPGFGIQIDSDDGFWTIRKMPCNKLWCLFRNIDCERSWGAYQSLHNAMEIAQETVDDEET